jgi:acetyltransferase-like isoleucine patch superfamily enzyme
MTMMFNNQNVRISPKATIGKNVRIGDDTVIFDNVVIEDNVTIAHNCILGEPLNDYYTNPDYKNPATLIGANSLIRSHALIYAGNKLGKNVSTGHRINLRENNVIGHDTVIGTCADIQGNVTIGNYTRIYSSVAIAPLTKIGNFVFIYAFAVLTNDPYPPSDDVKGCVISDYTQIAANSTILSGVNIGQNCLIGAGSVVNQNIPDYSLATGNPAKTIMDIRKFIIFGKGRIYPWMNRFERGMPWENIGYEKWMNGADQA